jgi:hypothetical protein
MSNEVMKIGKECYVKKFGLYEKEGKDCSVENVIFTDIVDNMIKMGLEKYPNAKIYAEKDLQGKDRFIFLII